MNVLEAIRTKRAVRQFTDQPLPEDVVHSILNAGRRSQSSKNNQAWKFIAIRDKKILQDLSTCGEWADHIAGAALAVAILIPDPNARFQHLVDCGQAAAYMQLAAWDLGVGSCPASIYKFDQARQILGFPDDWHLRITLSFGYPLHPETLTNPPKSGGRLSFDEVVKWEKWQQKW